MILVAGATGAIGQHVAAMAHAVGAPVRALARSWESTKSIKGLGLDIAVGDALDPASLKGVCDGIFCVVSCIGASVSWNAKDKLPFSAVDTVAHENLIREAVDAGVQRFVYVSVHAAPGYEDTAYAKAHRKVEEMLLATQMEICVIRPTGLFTAFDDLLEMSLKGHVTVIGDGEARTNPVHPKDIAALCVDAAFRGGGDRSAGGPEVFTRAGIARLAFDVRGEEPRLMHVPAAAIRLYGRAAGVFNRRRGELLEFAAAVSTHDALAPSTGYHRLRDHFYLLSRELAKRS